jgi:hypothetical protein
MIQGGIISIETNPSFDFLYMFHRDANYRWSNLGSNLFIFQVKAIYKDRYYILQHITLIAQL